MNKEKIFIIIRMFFSRLLILWIILAPFVWTLRDGLGPGAVDSAGELAVERFFITFYWGPILLLLILINLLLRKKYKKSNTPKNV